MEQHLENTPQAAGDYTFVFDGSTLPTGIYFYKLYANGITSVGKMIKE